MAITQLPPLSLYIHFPWCVKKCPYCDFNSHTAKAQIPDIDYVNALLADLDQELPTVWGRSITSIFIGGGTPSLMSVQAVDILLSGIRARLPFLSDMEITMEANPGTAEADKFKGFYNAGINRLSIGVQSFNNRQLKTLGRIHNSSEAISAFQMARKAGFKNINVDLMYALPDQSIAQAMVDLQSAIDLNPEHISWYQLTVEPNTLFHHSPPKNMASNDHLADISENGLQLLQQNNFQRYEVSAFSLLGERPAWHNTNYWQFGDYLGIGAGAHGKITRADTQQIIRTSKRRNPKDYLKTELDFIDRKQIVKQQDLPLEFMMNAMRLKEGVDENMFFHTTGLLLSQISAAIAQCVNRGLIVQEEGRLKPTDTGFNFLNEILSEFTDEHFTHLSNENRIEFTELK